MAFYAYNAGNPAPMPIAASGLGAFYAYDATHEAVQPVNGLAGLQGASGELADEAIRAALGRRKPVAVVQEWAHAVTDTVWKDSVSPNELSLLPLTDAILARAKVSAFGHAAPMIGIIGTEPASIELAERAFSGTPYKFHQSLAVRSIGDTKPMPTALFLWVGAEREPDDPDGGHGLLERTAGALRGKLVYMVALPRQTLRPAPPFQRALMMQFPPRARSAPLAPGTPAPPDTPSVVPLVGPGRTSIDVKGLGVVSPATILGGLALLVGAGTAVYCMRKG